MTGWRRLITTTVQLAHRDGTRLRRRPADERLLFKPVWETTGPSAERVRGIVTGAWALSPEICQGCGGPGDPVTRGRGRQRESGDEAPGLLEDLVGAQDLADLMDGRHTPFSEGIGAILSDVSATTCIYCGLRGRVRTRGWMHPACDQCWALEQQRNPELVNPNREPIQDRVRACS